MFIFLFEIFIIFDQAAGPLTWQILQILLEKNALTPEIVDKFFLEWVTELDFSMLHDNQFCLMETYLKLFSARCPVSITIVDHL